MAGPEVIAVAKRRPSSNLPQHKLDRPILDKPTLGWVPQPVLPSIEELVATEVYKQFGVTEKLLRAQQALEAHMTSIEVIEQAYFDRQTGRIGAEMFRGSCIGPRMKDGRPTREMCVMAIVPQKVRDHRRLGESCRLHELADRIGAPIDVVPVSRPRTMNWDLALPGPGDPQFSFQQIPPILGGTSVGPTNATGTFGGLVIGKDEEQYLLSNNHVLAGVSATIGTGSGAFGRGQVVGAEIRHPGPLDDPEGDAILVGRLANPVPVLKLHLSRGEAPLNDDLNSVDAAIAKVEPDDAATFFYHGLNTSVQSKPREQISSQLLVKKVGRTTGLTHGVVIAVNATTPEIGYVIGQLANGSPEMAFGKFGGCMVIKSLDSRPFSGRGDSGSLILAETEGKPQVVGLLFAGGTWPDPITGLPISDVTFAIPMSRVFDALKLDRFRTDL